MPSVLLAIEQQVGKITLHRPEKLNAFNREMAFELLAALDVCASNPEVRCVYLTGAGKGFSAGQDLAEITGAQALNLEVILKEHFNPVVARIRGLPKPVVAAVGGVAAGAGANIALCCDVVLASASASFIQSFSRIGLIPDSGGTYFLPRLVGWQKASALSLLGDKVSAAEAERMGMIYRVFPDETFATESWQVALRLASMPTRALGLIKEALGLSFTQDLDSQLLTEDALQCKAGQTGDFREGVNAFIEKRNPVFRGE